jgi:hypothetical protein
MGTSNGTYRVERTSWNITQGSAIDKGTYISFGAASAFQSTEDNGSITYRVIGKRLNGGSIDYSVQQTFSKAKKGSPTNFYYMASSIYSVRRLSNGTINPTQITLNGYYGNDVNPKIAYAGRLRLEYSDDGGQTWTVHSQSTVDETSRTINIPTGVARNAIRARLFESGGFTKVLDEEVIPYISDGTNGTNGVRTAVLEMYRWSAAQPTTFPSGNSTYTWATGSFTSPSSPNGWSLTPGAVVKGQTLWAISVIYTDSATSPTSIITWSSSAPYVAGYAGADGSTGDPGNPGLQVAWPSVFAWGSAPPSSLPAGTSSYNWSNGSFNLVTANGWSTSPPANPGTPGFKLWTVRRYITANAGTASTNFTWSGSAEAISANGANGVDGLKSASPTMFQWSNSVTPPALAGSTSFTWSSNDFSTSGITAGWVKTPGTGNPGQTLWAATVSLLDNAGAVTTTIDWSTASISPRGYQGLAGSTGSPGADGLSSRLAYTISASDTLSTPTATIGSSSLPVGYTSTPGTPTPNTNQKLFQTNGLYNPNTNQITWSTPYISTLRAGQLSVLSAYTGSLTVADRLTVVSGGDIVGGSFTGYAWPASGDGFYIGLSGILLGNKNTGPYLQMTRAGNIYSTQFKIENGVATFSGTLNATAGYFRGEMSTNGATYASGSGFYANGTQLRFGSLTSGLRYDGTKTEIFGDVVLTGNVKIDQITTRAQSTYDASVIPATGNITANASSLTFNTGSLPVTFSGNGNNLIETNVELYVHTNTTSGSTEAIRYLVEYQLYMNKGSITSISNMQRVLVATKKATDVHGFTANAMAYVPLTLSSIVTTSAGTGYVYMRITVRPYKSDDAALTFGSVGGTGGKYAYQLNLVNVEFKR